MNLLYTTPFLPFPPEDGGRMVAFHHLKGLSNRHRLTMILPLRRATDASHVPRLQELGEVKAVAIGARPLLGIAGSALLRGESFRIGRHRLPEIFREFEMALESEIDLVFLDSLFTGYLAPVVRRKRPELPVVLFEHNVESQMFRRLVTARRSPRWRLLAKWETPRIEAAERDATSNVTRVITLSEEDRETIQSLAPRANVSVCGPGIPTYPNERIAPPPADRTVLFLASYRWPPNLDGATWLASSLWPRVREKVAGARLVLAGPDPSGRVAQLADPAGGIETPGFVPSAVEATRSAAVAVAPLTSGGGVRIKILEALANERPLVATGLGAEGLDLEPGAHFLRADDADTFVAAIVRLLQNPEEAARLAAAGRRRVEERYSWPAAVARLDAVLEEVRSHARAEAGSAR